MSRTTIIPTVQTKANQETDLYIPYGAGGSVNIPGSLTVGGNLTVDGAVVDMSGSAVRVDDLRIDGSLSVYGSPVDMSGVTLVANVVGATAITATDTLYIGDPTDVGGGGAFVRGTLGNGTVYDSVYNRPGPTDFVFQQAGMLISGIPNPITTGQYVSGVEFTPTKTGMYLIEATIGCSGSVWTAAFGDKIQIVLVPVPAVPGVLPASSGVIMMSNGTGFSSWTSMSCDKLIAGVTYAVAADCENNSGTLDNNNNEITLDIFVTQLC